MLALSALPALQSPPASLPLLLPLFARRYAAMFHLVAIRRTHKTAAFVFGEHSLRRDLVGLLNWKEEAGIERKQRTALSETEKRRKVKKGKKRTTCLRRM